MNYAAVAAATAVALGAGGPAFADQNRTVRGTVFVDADGDGALSSGDERVAGALVVWNTDVFERTDSDGRFAMDVPSADGVVWVRTTDEFRPGEAWTAVGPGDATASIQLHRVEPGPRTALSFVVAADTHVGIDDMPVEAVEAALVQAGGVSPTPRFVAIVGDLTQTNDAAEFDALRAAAAGIAPALIAVPGNHDWYDDGASYIAAFGPPTYSFDAGGVHFVVLNGADTVDRLAAFLRQDVAHLDGDPLIAAFVHAPPESDLIAALAGAGVDYLYTGHQHANRVVDHGGLVELNTQPLAMGGIDQTPAGFRVVALSADGQRLESVHHTIVDEPVATIVYPRPGDIVAPCAAVVLAAVEPGIDVQSVWLTLPGARPAQMHPAGGWLYSHDAADLCEPGTHDAVLSVVTSGRTALTAVAPIRVGTAPAPDPNAGDWPMLGGDPAHLGRAGAPLAPPLETVWARPVGGHVQGGSPVVADGRVFVSVVDYDDGHDGAVVALDLATGRELWRYRAGAGVRNAPAVAHGVVVAARVDGLVVGLDAATGDELWTYGLAWRAARMRRNIYSAPVIRGHVVHVGIQRELVALDVRTGERLWTISPHWSGGEGSSYASPAVAGGILVASFSRGLYGMTAYDAYTGALLWRTEPDVSRHLNASPVLAGDTAYVTNELGELFAVDIHDGTTRWRTALGDGGFPWSFSVTAGAALDGDTLFAPGPGGRLHAIDTATGRERWSARTGRGLVRAAHYHGPAPQLSASPVVAGPVVWIAGADGVVRALDAGDGQLLWSYDVGAPVLASPVPAGSQLVIASYDGTVRLMRGADRLIVSRIAPAGFGPASDAERGALGTALLFGLVTVQLLRRRRERTQG